MDDEIKEILDYLKDEKWDYYPSDMTPYKVFLMEERDKLLDYITNLQQENERLKLELSGYREAILRDDKLLGLQQRIEKTIHLINHSDITDYRVFDEELLNILNGKEGD